MSVLNNIILRISLMSHFPNHTFPYLQDQGYTWCHPYYYQNPQYYSYFNPSTFNYLQRPYYPAYQTKNFPGTQPQVIKLQQESNSNQNRKQFGQNNSKKKQGKTLKKKKVETKIPKVDQNMYLHPPKFVNYKARYFDPNSAPVITSSLYNLVDDRQKEMIRSQILSNGPIDDANQLEFPQEDLNPFIVFKFRRIKKKFKKYVKPKDEYFLVEKVENSQSDNDEDNSSDYSGSQSDAKQQQNQADPHVQIIDESVEKDQRNGNTRTKKK